MVERGLRPHDRGALRPPDLHYEGYIFDLDGTVYLGRDLLPGALEVITELRRRGRRVVFVTNNPTRHPAVYAAKLSRLGIPTRADEVVSPLVTAPAWLLSHHRDDGIFVIGEEPITQTLARAGLRLTDHPGDVGVVVASFDRTFAYAKLQVAFDVLRRDGAVLVSTNQDPYCPVEGGGGEPDAGAIVAAIEACTGVRCSTNLGKPGPVMLETVRAMLGLPIERCLMIGDRLGTDIAMARITGMDSAVVLTGETTAAALGRLSPTQAPTWIVGGIGELLPA